jgi:hypothetical protein
MVRSKIEMRIWSEDSKIEETDRFLAEILIVFVRLFVSHTVQYYVYEPSDILGESLLKSGNSLLKHC